MNREETHRLLRQRSALTSQPYGDETIDAWHTAFTAWTFDQCQRALVHAARQHSKITVAHMTAELPRPQTPATPSELERWAGPTDTGRHALTMLRAHTRGQHRRLPAHDCPACTPAATHALQEEDTLW